MNYFKFHIGDYAKKCGRLSMLEHGAYTQLIQACYDRERFPTLDEAIDWIWARSDEEVAAVKFVLGRFFTFEDGVYVQSRIKDEINAYNAVCAKNAEIATEREAKRKNNKRDANEASTERAPSVHEESTNRHLTTNHKPLTINQEPNKPPYPPPGGDGFEEFWELYPKKVGKAAAAKAWRKLKPDVGKQAVMLEALSVHVASESWRKDGGQFVPNPATWINGARWEDEVQASPVVAGRIGVNAEALRALDYQQRLFDHDVSPQDKRRRRIDWIITLEGLYEPSGYDEGRLQERRDIVLKNARLEPGQTMRELFKTAYGTDPQSEIEVRLAHLRGANGVAA
jgi:uncharacterized protein YdaU (DUF1376 family)